MFSQFVGMLELLRAKLDEKNIPFEYLTGQTKDRGARVHNFQTNKEVRVFLVSLKAGGVGLNLTAADYVYLVDPGGTRLQKTRQLTEVTASARTKMW
ncbi:SWF/SNF helicase family protein [Niabella sp. W65]|nr:SWF/SNF helicase family protein [Niabella sp. W65]MCH7363004.1 SWF/SNF helicase family protein [Niabella sp. W65]